MSKWNSKTMDPWIKAKLSPQAQIAYYEGGTQRVESLIEVRGTANQDRLKHGIAAAGGRIVGAQSAGSTIVVEIPANRLDHLAALPDVVFVETQNDLA